MYQSTAETTPDLFGPRAAPPHAPDRTRRAGQAPSNSRRIFRAAVRLLPAFEAGEKIERRRLRDALTGAFGASDAEGAWQWKHAYEAAETAVVLLLVRYGRALLREAEHPDAMLPLLDSIAALEPPQTRRSHEQVRLQQFSTPLQMAWAASVAAAIRADDTVLEPSAGTGMLAALAALRVDANAGGRLHLNELAGTRAGLLRHCFPDTEVTRHDAEHIRDLLPDLHPSVVLMNPPFSRSPHLDRIRRDADLRHVRAAYAALRPGGRIVAITSSGAVPGNRDWIDLFATADPRPDILFTTPVDGRLYQSRGTTYDTRVSVIEKPLDGEERTDNAAQVALERPMTSADHLLGAILDRLPPRRQTRLPAPRVAPPPRKTATPRRRKQSLLETLPREWGPTSEIDYRTEKPASTDARVVRRQAVPPLGAGRRGRRPTPPPTRPPWCSPPQWRRYATPIRPRARCCPLGWSPTTRCPTPSSRASCSPPRRTAEHLQATYRISDDHELVRRVNDAGKLHRRRPRRQGRRPALRRARCAFARAGCSATAPAAARAARSPP